MSKIRVCLAYREDIRGVLSKIMESDAYQKFRREFRRLNAKYRSQITLEEAIGLDGSRKSVMNRLQAELINSYLMPKIIHPYRSRRKPGKYQKAAVSRIRRFIRVLLHNALQIMPEYHEFLARKLEELVEDFTQKRIL